MIPSKEEVEEALEHGMLICGKSEEVLAEFPKNSIDLIYGDPPFCSEENYNDMWNIGEVEREFLAFIDLCKDGIYGYINRMRPILEECYRVLKPNGSMYIHCDRRVSHYMKIELDRIFGEGKPEEGMKHFNAEIIWHYGLGASNNKKTLLRKHDNIFLYTKSTTEYTFNIQRGEITPQMEKKYCHEDKDGKYMKTYGKKFYLKGGKMLDDVWGDIPNIAPTSKERLGYGTQKPEKLLDRIITISSKKGDIVLDPFNGGGTTPAMVLKMGEKRIPIGIDIYPGSILKTKYRTHGYIKALGIENEDFDNFVKEYVDYGPILDKYFGMNCDDFEAWAVRELNGRVTKKKGRGDGGIDGIIDAKETAIQVKQQKKIGREEHDKFRGAMRNHGFKKGIIVAFSFTSGMREQIEKDIIEESSEQITLITTEELLRGKTITDLQSTIEEFKAKRFVAKPLSGIFKGKSVDLT